MESFEYARPTNLQDALALLAPAEGEPAVLAGSTDLLALMKDYIVRPTRLVSIRFIPELKGIHYDATQGLRLGAAVTLEQIAEHADIRREYPALSGAAREIGGPQIRAAGTLGGNLCQRPRCWYFRNGYGLLALLDGESMVVKGDNRYHAILGTSGPAYFVQPSTLAPALIALGGKIRILGPKGEREVPVEEFYRIPETEGEKEYRLDSGELITEVLVPPREGRLNASYEVQQKVTMDWPLVMAAVSLELDGPNVRDARVVLGQVAPVPWVSSEAAEALKGGTVTEETADAAGRAAVASAQPLSRNTYKVRLARVAVKRAILRAAGKEV